MQVVVSCSTKEILNILDEKPQALRLIDSDRLSLSLAPADNLPTISLCAPSFYRNWLLFFQILRERTGFGFTIPHALESTRQVLGHDFSIGAR